MGGNKYFFVELFHVHIRFRWQTFRPARRKNLAAEEKFGPLVSFSFLKAFLWWRNICSYCVSRLDRHVTYYTSHMCTYVDTRLSLPSLKYTVVAWLLTCLHLSTSGDPAFDFTRGHASQHVFSPTCTFSNIKLST